MCQLDKQKIDEVEREHIPERKLEIELPGAGSRWQVPFGVAKSQTELNNLEQINIAFQGLIVIVVRNLEGANRPSNNTRKLSILLVVEEITSSSDMCGRWKGFTIAMFG